VSAGERRPFRLHVPEDPDLRLDPVIAFDGVTLWNPEGNMGGINGLDEASDKYKFVAVYPIPKTRYFGSIAGWNTPGGCLTYRAGYDDLDYVQEIFTLLSIERAYAIGFSAGAQFAHILAGKLPGRITGVGSICGSWLGTEPQPAPGTALLVVHGEEDPVQPYHGGPARMMRVRLLAALGNRNLLLSRPDLQAQAYAAANAYGPVPQIEETEVYVKRTFGPGTAPAVEYLIRHPYGGHTYHGRRTGKGTESDLSRQHGRPLPPEKFSCNDKFAATMGFTRCLEGS